MQQITRGDYLKDLITIFIENNLQQDITELYSQFIFQCGAIQKTFTPAQVIKISFNEQESLQLKNINVCYLAGITSDGHKETFNGSLTFNTRGEVVMYEPANISAANVTTSDAPQCSCQGLNAVYSNCCQPAIKAYFSLNYVPTKLSELQNDTDFQDSVDVSDAISEHNTSEDAHQYIQELISTAELNINTTIGDLTNLETSVKSSVVNAINSEVSARENADTGLSNDYNAKIGTLSNLESSVKTDVVSAINSVISDTDTTIGDLTDLDTSVKTSVVNAINSEVSDRISADNDLQGQIDALSAASDVTDIVGTYAELQAYDTQHLNDNDIIKVLSDSTHNNAPSYYRYNKSTDSFTYIGSESASYTKAESDALFVPQTRTVNSKALSSDITLTSSDVGALASTTTINDLTTTAQQNALNSGATTTNIGQIATNTSNISTINGKIPSDASSSNKLVTASTLSNAVVNLADKDLSNLTQTGNDRLHALKSYSDKGELLTDAEGLAYVKSYAHSTFDLSKFTVVGTPMITDDGIASGFYAGSGETTSAIDAIKFEPGTNSWKVKLRYIFKPIVTGSNILIYNSNGDKGLLAIITNNRVDMYVQFEGGTYNHVAAFKNNVTFAENDIIDCVFDYDKETTTYSNTVYLNGEFYATANFVDAGIIRQTDAGLMRLGARQSNAAYCRGSFDLKQFSITVEGVSVFSGNKTGIDTIKPDDYTIVGTPTISNDGVISGLSSGNYVSTTIPQYGNDFVFKAKFKTGSSTTSTLREYILRSTNFSVYFQQYNSAYYIPAIEIKDGTNTNSLRSYANNWTASADTEYEIECGYNSTTHYIYIKIWETLTGTLVHTVTNTLGTNVTDISSFTNIAAAIGSNENGTNNFWPSDIDLNGIKTYSNGSLAYQPCLKIPYTLSKTGSKVVNSIYRDRVDDMAGQFGYANYYTLSDTDFTLPQVELYGLIGDKRLVKSYYNGLTYWELYSNRRLEQGGTCESGVEYTFTKPFVDTNYVLTIPYTSKTATTFIPSATGDFIAKGTGTL